MLSIIRRRAGDSEGSTWVKMAISASPLNGLLKKAWSALGKGELARGAGAEGAHHDDFRLRLLGACIGHDVYTVARRHHQIGDHPGDGTRGQCLDLGLDGRHIDSLIAGAYEPALQQVNHAEIITNHQGLRCFAHRVFPLPGLTGGG
jgi:hypothetical protein